MLLRCLHEINVFTVYCLSGGCAGGTECGGATEGG